ncbi:MAG: calycin-like domain-containing protein [Paludibacteraceae bacterium]|nr:calycin-like domain-containing protein [Paludibacteraceae bacterium]
MNKILFFISLSLIFFVTLPSCLEDDQYGEGLEVFGKGDNRRAIIHDDEEEEEEEEEDPVSSDTTATFDFTTLSGTYEGDLLIENEASPLPVTVVANSNKTFDLALYNAVVDGMELGDLIFEGIPAKKDNQSWKFNVSRNVELLGGSIQADVDVNGVVTEKGDLSFVVAIVTPPIELTYKGKKKEN